MDGIDACQLREELDTFEFPQCHLYHENIRTQVSDSCFVVHQIGVTHLNSECPPCVQERRPGCPHFNDRRKSDEGVDSILAAGNFLGVHDKMVRYLQHRDALTIIDNTIRLVRKYTYYNSKGITPPNGDLGSQQCDHVRAQLATRALPSELEKIIRVEDFEELLLDWHHYILEELEEIVQMLKEVLSDAVKDGSV